MSWTPGYGTSPEETRPHPRPSWLRTAIGALLVLLGVEILLERLLDRELSLLLPALGIVLLAAWSRHDRFPFLVSGALLLGAGLGSLLESAVGPAVSFADAAGLAWGFWLIQQLSGRRIGWARVGFLIALSAALFELAMTVGLGNALGAVFGGAAAPLALMIVGLLLVFRRRLSPRLFVVAVIVAVSLGLSAAGDVIAGGLSGLGDGLAPRRTVAVELPDLNERTLVLEGRSDDVALVTGETLSVTASVRGRHGRIDVDDSDSTEVVIRNDDPRWGPWHEVDYKVVVPPGTDLRIDLRSGDVEAVIGGIDLHIETTSGDVELVASGDPDIDVETGSGDVVAAGFGADDGDAEGSWSYDGDGTDAISIATTSGDVALVRQESALR